MMFSRDNSRCLFILWRNFLREFYGDMNRGPSYETLVLFFINHRLTRKILEMRHFKRDEEARRLYRQDIANIYWRNIIAIDEMGCSPDQMREKWGYAIQGNPAIKTQIKIGKSNMALISRIKSNVLYFNISYSLYQFCIYNMHVHLVYTIHR